MDSNNNNNIDQSKKIQENLADIIKPDTFNNLAQTNTYQNPTANAAPTRTPNQTLADIVSVNSSNSGTTPPSANQPYSDLKNNSYSGPIGQQKTEYQSENNLNSSGPFFQPQDATVTEQNNNGGFPPKKSGLKKKLILVGSFFVITPAVAFAGFFGYKQYIKSSDVKVLGMAVQKFVDSKGFSSDFRIGFIGASVEGKFVADKENNLKLEIKNPIMPIELIYLKKEDKAYFKTPDYSDANFYSEKTYDKTPASKEAWTEYSNVLKAYIKMIEKYSKDIGGYNLAITDPKNSYLKKENIKFIKRAENEKIDGKNLLKYEFTPSKEVIDKTFEDINKKNDLGIALENTKIKTEFWINQKDFSLFKVKSEVSFKIKDGENSFLKMNEQDFKWEQQFNYDFKDTIKLPENPKIIDSHDLLEIVDDLLSAMEDSKNQSANYGKRSNLNQVKI